MNNDDFDKRYNELLKKTEELYLDPNKINIISDEFIVDNAIHYDNGNDNFRTVPRFASRINSLFSNMNIDVYFFCSTRNQTEIIPSLYMAAASELNRSMSFSGEEIIQYLKTKNTNKPKIKRLLAGFRYWELYKNLDNAVGKNKIKFFLYEEFKNNYGNFVSDLSNYLEIDPSISTRLLKYNKENTTSNELKEHPHIHSPLSIVFSKLINNFNNPKYLFENFNNKSFNMFKLLFKQMAKYSQKDKEIAKIKKENLIKKFNIIKNNSPLVKKYYRNDCLELKNKLKLDIDKYDYL